MAAALAEIYNAVNAYHLLALQALDWGSTYRPDLVLPSYAYGPAGKVAKASAPQVAWVFGEEKFGPPVAIRGVRTEYGIQRRPIHTRWMSVQVHIWAPKNVYSPVKRLGSMQGHLSFSGTPVAVPFAVVQLLVTTAGPVTGMGPFAQFTYSLDGGATFSGPVAAGPGPVVLGASGITVTFAVAGGGNGLALNDAFEFVAYGQQIADYSTGETMMEAFVAAVRYMLSGSYELGEGSWSGQSGDELTQMGSEYVLPVKIRTPVSEINLPADTALAKISSIQQTDQIGSTITIP